MYITRLAWLRPRKARIEPTFVLFPVRVPAASSLTPVTNPSRAVGATSAHRGLRRHVPPLSLSLSHTHTHTHSLSLSLSLCPLAFARLTTANPPPPYSHRHLPLSNSRAAYPSAIYRPPLPHHMRPEVACALARTLVRSHLHHRQCCDAARDRRGRHWGRRSVQAHGCRCGGVGHVNLVGVGRRRHGCRVGRGALIVGAGRGRGYGHCARWCAGVGRDAEERVHPATFSCWVRVVMRVQRWPDSAGVVVPVEVKRTTSASSEIRLKIRSYHACQLHRALNGCFHALISHRRYASPRVKKCSFPYRWCSIFFSCPRLPRHSA